MENLPEDLLINQLAKLKFKDLSNACKTSKRIADVCKRNVGYIVSSGIAGRKNIQVSDHFKIMKEALTSAPYSILKMLTGRLDMNATDGKSTVLLTALEVADKMPRHWNTIVNLILDRSSKETIAKTNTRKQNALMVLLREPFLAISGLNVFDRLVESGIDVNAKDYDGNTALMIAMYSGLAPEKTDGLGSGLHIPTFVLSVIIDKLLKHGADPKINNKGGDTAMRIFRYVNERHGVSYIDQRLKYKFKHNKPQRIKNTKENVYFQNVTNDTRIEEWLTVPDYEFRRHFTDPEGVGQGEFQDEWESEGEFEGELEGGSNTFSDTESEGRPQVGGASIEDLPEEIILQQLAELDYEDLQNMCKMNKRIADICERNETYIYKAIYERAFGKISNPFRTWDKALKNNNMKKIRLLSKVVDINASRVKRREHNTVLLVALEYSAPKIIHYILDQNPDVNLGNIEGETPLMIAMKMTGTDIVNRIIDMGADVNVTISGDSPLYFALHHYGKDQDIKIKYTFKRNPDTIRKLIEKGADVNAIIYAPNASTMLSTAIHKDVPIDIIENIIKKCTRENINFLDAQRYTALGVSMMLYDMTTWESTLNRHTPEEITQMREKQIAIIQLLLDHGADVNIGQLQGVTPLQRAKNLGLPDHVKRKITEKGN